ncbi:Protein-glutamate methylesterase/protein-glutamine glutaminase [Dyadobacter sp. CECT 9623]|uniref:protein-glutamate methylesterase n=1 Tax=Dyadobacter linearis TaxID=2823330 RepID=A0ABM8UNA9_9BACT|nr:chemotaxis protein CheB [Dyadobacter sp. CECT 9623]CAG5068856.1 Protein-glutamate methylesterase/protein-glutamine glutaminase [Dyadobacter sp. CECT 9623]
MEENRITPHCELLLIGGSAGSLEVLFKLLPLLKADLPFPVVLVLHRRNSGDSSLTELLASKSSLFTSEVEDKDPILAGNIYLAPADYHLLIENDRSFSLDYSEKINYSRPSIDVTFESAANIYGCSVVAALLSGANEDGTRGLMAIQKAGGRTVAQLPATAQMPFMPQHAITSDAAGLVLDIPGMAHFFNTLE